jgi:MMP 1-O-methyltransferase
MAVMTGWRDYALAAKGFMPAQEGDALYAAALAAADAVPGAPFVEVGSYCGRSTIWLAAAARESGTVVFAVDHHRGSEENQVGWQHHDPDVVDSRVGRIDTLPLFRRALFDAGLEPYAVAVVGESPLVAAHWTTPAALVFIDGGHGVEPARADYAGWAPKVARDGSLAIHDVFPDPADGGRPPYEDIYLPAIESSRFALTATTGSLRVLRCVAVTPSAGPSPG